MPSILSGIIRYLYFSGFSVFSLMHASYGDISGIKQNCFHQRKRRESKKADCLRIKGVWVFCRHLFDFFCCFLGGKAFFLKISSNMECFEFKDVFPPFSAIVSQDKFFSRKYSFLTILFGEVLQFLTRVRDKNQIIEANGFL